MTKKKTQPSTLNTIDESVLLNPPQELVEKVTSSWDRWQAKRQDLETVTIDDGEKLHHAQILTDEQSQVKAVNVKLDAMYRRLRHDMDHQLKLPFDQCKLAMTEVMKAQGFTGRNYRVDQTNIPQILNNMIRWTMYDSACEWDLRKGIYLWSDVGKGKTQLAKFFSGFTYAVGFRHSELVHVKSIIIDISDAKTLAPLKKYLQGKWLFNDIGHEEDDRLMGNKIDLVDRLFCIRADEGLLTHATGNVPPAQVKNVYGKRVASRFNELFTAVEVTGPWDFREDIWKQGFPLTAH